MEDKKLFLHVLINCQPGHEWNGSQWQYPYRNRGSFNLYQHHFIWTHETSWVFTGVQATIDFTDGKNFNAAELRARHGVLWRKTSYGSHSAEGSRFVERILTAHASLRLQNRNVLDFVREASAALLNRSHPPSLLPTLDPRQSHRAT